MTQRTPSEQIRTALQIKYHEFIFDESPIHGTYGLVWLARDSRTGNALAFKSLDFGRDGVTQAIEDFAYLQREFRKWMKLPPSRNILGALGYDLVRIELDGVEVEDLPVMRMKGMKGSLDDWVGNNDFSHAERLVAVIQMFSGLEDLYDAGLEGHGDLKPSNILYTSLSDSFSLPDVSGWPTKNNPWQIVVADFGWADAWVDLGFTNKALREYMAPERFDNVFVKDKSDVFAAGLIAGALFTGEHPARNLKKARKSQGNWRRCVDNRDWVLESIDDPDLRDLIAICLAPIPDDRPTASEALVRLCKIYDRDSEDSIAEYLPHWKFRMSGVQRLEHLVDAAQRSVNLGAKERREAAGELVIELGELRRDDIYDFEKWISCAKALVFLHDQDENAVDSEVVSSVLATAQGVLKGPLNDFTPDDIEAIAKRDDWASVVHPFERFSGIVERFLDLVGTDYEKEKSGQGLGVTNGVLLGALAYQSASAYRYADLSKCIQILSEAIDGYPAQPVFHYFRYRWIDEYLWGKSHKLSEGGLDMSDEQLREIADSDLNQARVLDPNWLSKL